MVIRDIEREDIEFISSTLNCLPISHVDHMKPEKLGHADLVQEVEVGSLLLSNMSPHRFSSSILSACGCARPCHARPCWSHH